MNFVYSFRTQRPKHIFRKNPKNDPEMERLNINTWLDGVLYCGLDFSEYERYEHYVQYLIDNKYEHNNTRFFRILNVSDKDYSRAISNSRSDYHPDYLVGIEQI